MFELLPMKKSRKKLREGDVFVLQPFEEFYIFGKVIRTNLISKNVFVNGMFLVHIYKEMSKGIPDVIPELDTSKLLLPPQIINRLAWSRGYFMNIGHQFVEEIPKSYGFKWLSRKTFWDIDGNQIDKPKICGNYALGNYLTIGDELNELYEKHPDLYNDDFSSLK